MGNAREGRINPFHIYKILTEDGTPADPKVTFNTHLKMLESFFKIVLADAPVDVIELINNLVVETYESSFPICLKLCSQRIRSVWIA